MAQSTVDAFSGAIIGVAVGDALGNPLEGMSPDEIRRSYGRVSDYISARDPKGTVTDDTELTILLAESLIANQGCNVDDFAARLADWIEHARHYGVALKESCTRLRNGVPPSESGSASAGNGAAMRVTPIGLVYNRASQRDQLLDCVDRTSRVTHADDRSIAGAAAVAAAVAYSVNHSGDFNRNDLLDDAARAAAVFSADMAEAIADARALVDADPATAANELGAGGFVMESVPFSLYCATHQPTFESAVLTAVNAGGDTDTNAAIAGGIVGAFAGAHSIPPGWAHGLSRPMIHYGHLVTLGERLHELHRSI